MHQENDPAWLTATEGLACLRSCRLSAREWTQCCLDRIQLHASHLRAWVSLDVEAALARADALDRSPSDRERPLAGVPMGIKDLFDIAGLPTRAGSRFRQNHAARRDAAIVGQLRQAGAVFLGKTVTTEFACFDPAETRNPWNAAHTPGGSSSGSAAAVAAGMCPLAIGSQTGGSVIRPASYCGVVGFKPSFGRVSRRGVVPVSWHLDHVGWFARCVADVSLVFACLKRGSRAPRTLVRGGAPQKEGLRGVRLGMLQGLFAQESATAVRSNLDAAARKLASAGADILPLALPPTFADVYHWHRMIMAVEAAAVHRRRFERHRGLYGANLAALLDEGLSVSTVDYAMALAHQRRFQREFGHLLHDVDALFTPSTPTTAPASRDTTGDPRFNSPFTYAGAPVLGIPMGLADDGMPTGLQLIGRRGDDERLLHLAARCEEALAPMPRPQLLQDL